MRRKRTVAGAVLALGLGLTGCGDAADTEVDLPEVDVPETISPEIGEGEGEGEGEGG